MLSRQERIKYKGLFQQAYNKGKTLVSPNFRVSFTKTLAHCADKLPLVGFVVSKNYSKKAVNRNRIKRQVREVYRIYRQNPEHVQRLKSIGLLVITIKPEAKFSSEELLGLLASLG